MESWLPYLFEDRVSDRRAEAERVRPPRSDRVGVRRWRVFGRRGLRPR
jgi:hypothetical protein